MAARNAQRHAPEGPFNARDFPRSELHCGTPQRLSGAWPLARRFRVEPPVPAWSMRGPWSRTRMEPAGMDVADRSIRQSDRKIRGCCHDRVRNPL